MTKIQEKTKQNQSVFWILVHKALDKNDGQIFCLPVAWSSNEEICSCSGFERMVQIDWYLKARRSTQKEENSLKQNEFM